MVIVFQGKSAPTVCQGFCEFVFNRIPFYFLYQLLVLLSFE